MYAPSDSASPSLSTRNSDNMGCAWNTVGKKICARRILSFLRRHSLEFTAHQMERETAVFFAPSRLVSLASSGLWRDLAGYVYRFFTRWGGEPLSPEASAFLLCLHDYRVLDEIAAGKHAGVVSTAYPLLDAGGQANPGTAALQGPHRDFASRLRFLAEAAERLKHLALKCPELKGKLQVPRAPSP